jgi:membrane protease YdiL (CAAX protease family)
MPIKLKSSDHRVIVIALLTAVVSIAVGSKYFWRAFPEAAIDFRVNRDDSAPMAQKFLSERRIHVEGYRHVAVFDYDDAAKVYLERTQGLERMNTLARGPIHLWRWSHRWFKPQQQEEFRVEVTPSGEVVGFDHEIPEALPGASLDDTAAREIAERFLREVMKRDLADLEFVEADTQKRPARTDHDFTWKQKSVALGDGSWRVEVEVDGDQVSGYREFVKIPEQWSREYQKLRSRNQSAQLVAEVLLILLTVGMVVILILRLRDRDVPVKLSLILGLVGTVLYFLGQLNNFPMAEFGYSTTDSYSSFVAGYVQRSLLAAAGVGAWIFFLTASSEPVYRAGYPALTALGRAFRWQGLRTRSFFLANVVGITLTCFFFAYQTVFYLAANKLGAWAPSEVNYSDLLSTKIPWVWVLFIGFLPAVSEELQFRAFAIPFLQRLLRGKVVALVLAAFVWGFLHSAYPNQPFFIRGVEVGVGGVIVGLIMLRFGLVATLIWHYSVDAIYTAFLLLRSPNHYLMVSGAITAGIMLVPLVVSLVAYLRAGTFSDETALSNADAGVRRAPPREAAREMEAPLVYQPLTSSRLLLAGVLIVVFAALAFMPVHRFGEDTKIRMTRQDAEHIADGYLKRFQVDPAGYRRVAWLHVNVDPSVVKYLQEQRSVADVDRIYRQATRLLLWQVRYFRPLEKEEWRIYVDPTDGRVFSYRHILDENAPGASLTAEQARARVAEFLEQQGYRLADFEPQEASEEKRKARTDHTLVWQIKPTGPGAALTVKDAHFRLQVEVTGDQIAGLSRYFKLPEEWQRQQRASTLTTILLLACLTLLIVALVGGALILFVVQVRRGVISWARAGKPAAIVLGLLVCAELNQISRVFQSYNTSEPLSTFWITAGTGLAVVPLVGALAAWVVIGLATSLYPDAWRIFRGHARSVWRRDAAVAIAVSLAAALGLSRLGTLVYDHFHSHAPVSFDLGQDLLDATLPGAGFAVRGMIYALIFPAILGLIIFMIQQGLKRRPWWVWVGGLLLLVSLGPWRAHSFPEFLVGWSTGFLTVLVACAVVVFFLRGNPVAYMGTVFALTVVEPLVSIFSQPASFFRWNAVFLGLVAVLFLAWMFSGSRFSNGQVPEPPSTSSHSDTSG